MNIDFDREKMFTSLKEVFDEAKTILSENDLPPLEDIIDEAIMIEEDDLATLYRCLIEIDQIIDKNV